MYGLDLPKNIITTSLIIYIYMYMICIYFVYVCIYIHICRYTSMYTHTITGTTGPIPDPRLKPLALGREGGGRCYNSPQGQLLKRLCCM